MKTNTLGLTPVPLLKKFCKEAGVVKAELITSTNLRKYLATVSQVVCLSNEELEWLCNHLGHSINVHRNFYRLQESTLELTKISKLLLAVDEGSVHDLAGKDLNDSFVDSMLDPNDFKNLESTNKTVSSVTEDASTDIAALPEG